MSETSALIQLLSDAVALLRRKLGDLTARVVRLEQTPWASGTGGAGGAGVALASYVAMAPASGTIAGTWSGSAPTAGGSFSATVYRVSGTGTVTGLGTQTIVNWLPGVLANSKACIVQPDGTGNYVVVSQSCT